MALFLLANYAMPTTSPPTPVVLAANTVTTLLQFKPSATIGAKVVGWAFSGNATTAGVPGTVELIETDVAATVTAYVANDITKYDANALMGGDPTTNLIQVGTSSSGYTASAEGTITAIRTLDVQQIAPTTQFDKTFPLGNYGFVQCNKFLRIRAKFAATVSILCYVIIEI